METSGYPYEVKPKLSYPLKVSFGLLIILLWALVFYAATKNSESQAVKECVLSGQSLEYCEKELRS